MVRLNIFMVDMMKKSGEFERQITIMLADKSVRFRMGVLLWFTNIWFIFVIVIINVITINYILI